MGFKRIGQLTMSKTKVLIFVSMFCISINITNGSVDKAKEAWLRHIKSEYMREHQESQPTGKPKVSNKKTGRVDAQVTRASMMGAVFSSLRWPELHTSGFLPQELDCPQIGDRTIRNTSRGLPMGLAGRAIKSLPPQFFVTWSSIPGAGMGVFSKTFIREHTWLAEYEGRVIEWTDNITRTDTKKRLARLNRLMDYGWVTSSYGMPKYLIEASREGYSNWLRYINMAVRQSDQNVMPAQCADKFYYRTSKPIPPGYELLTNYGVNYMLKLGINPDDYYAN